MKLVVQRVQQAKLIINGVIHSEIGNGLLALVGFTAGDNTDTLDYYVNKLLKLRVFDDADGVMNLSVEDVKGKIMAISQFTLYADTKKGNRPSYTNALRPELATKLYDAFCDKLQAKIDTARGVFGAHMDIDFVNDGPVTIIIEK